MSAKLSTGSAAPLGPRAAAFQFEQFELSRQACYREHHRRADEHPFVHPHATSPPRTRTACRSHLPALSVDCPRSLGLKIHAHLVAPIIQGEAAVWGFSIHNFIWHAIVRSRPVVFCQSRLVAGRESLVPATPTVCPKTGYVAWYHIWRQTMHISSGLFCRTVI
jgi:hypothetical protein